MGVVASDSGIWSSLASLVVGILRGTFFGLVVMSIGNDFGIVGGNMVADRSTDFQYVLEALYFLHSLVDEAESLNEEAQFTAIVQTVARHLEVFLS